MRVCGGKVGEEGVGEGYGRRVWGKVGNEGVGKGTEGGCGGEGRE